MAQEGLHSLNTMNLKGAILKLDLSKASDKASWMYLWLLLTHVGFSLDFITWVMSCIQMVSFVVLINGVSSPFFHVQRGLHHGRPLSPLLFLIVVEGLNRILGEVKNNGDFYGCMVNRALDIYHLLFIDNILILCNGDIQEVC